MTFASPLRAYMKANHLSVTDFARALERNSHFIEDTWRFRIEQLLSGENTPYYPYATYDYKKGAYRPLAKALARRIGIPVKTLFPERFFQEQSERSYTTYWNRLQQDLAFTKPAQPTRGSRRIKRVRPAPNL